MIFCSKNEVGELASYMVMQNRKTVTRRLKPVKVGTIIAVQPGRGKFAVGHVRVVSCEKHIDWLLGQDESWDNLDDIARNAEAQREGFKTWRGLMGWLDAHGIDICDTYRIEFEVLEASPRVERGAGSVTLVNGGD